MDKQFPEVNNVKDDIFRINFPPKMIPVNAESFLLFGSHRIEVVLDKSEKFVTAIEGPRNTLLMWLERLGISDKILETYKKAMEI